MPTLPSKQVRGDCANCGRGKNATIRASVPRSGVVGEDLQYWERHYLLECGGCGAVYYQRSEADTEDLDENGAPIDHVTNWPGAPERARPEWFNEVLAEDYGLYQIMTEIYDAIDAKLKIVPVIGMRTAIDRMTELLGIDAALTFDKKVAALVAGGHIGTSEKAHIDTIIQAGNAAAHRGWRPKSREISVLMSAVEAFVQRNLLADEKLKKVKARVPAKPKAQQSKATR
jgi:hypothetical protein